MTAHAQQRVTIHTDSASKQHEIWVAEPRRRRVWVRRCTQRPRGSRRPASDLMSAQTPAALARSIAGTSLWQSDHAEVPGTFFGVWQR